MPAYSPLFPRRPFLEHLSEMATTRPGGFRERRFTGVMSGLQPGVALI